jgi:8-oxo-dGTP pyrophosphatase MutT (NUDIX family)
MTTQIIKPLTLEIARADGDPSDVNYWCDAAAGCFFIARDTGRILFCHRAAGVEAPNTWAAWGGGLEKGESPMSAMTREVNEETGLDPSIIEEFHPLYTHEDPESGFQYHSFLAVVPHEFIPKLAPREAQDYQWVPFGEWPQPLHKGVQYMFARTQVLDTIHQHLRGRTDMMTQMNTQNVIARLKVTADAGIPAILKQFGFVKGKKTNDHLLNNADTYTKGKYILYHGAQKDLQSGTLGWFLYEKLPNGKDKWLNMGTSAFTLERAFRKLEITANIQTAALDEPQLQALRTRVIPILRGAVGPDYGPDAITWKVLNSHRASPAVGKAAMLASGVQWAWERVTKFIEAVASKQTPVKRAAILRRYLAIPRIRNYREFEDLPTLLNSVLKESKKALALAKLGMTPIGKEKLEGLMADPVIGLLRKSWGFIVSEVQEEYAGLLKQYKFMEVKEGMNGQKMQQQFTEHMKSLGYTISPYNGSEKYMKGFASAAKDDKRITFIPPDKKAGNWSGGNGALFPEYKLAQHGDYWFDYGRTGVEGGETYLEDDNLLEGVIDELIEKMDKTIKASEEREARGIQVKFCPESSRKLLPENLEKIVDKLKGGGTYSIEPSGFGTAYLFSIRRFANARPADKDISDRVGQQVYYTEHDRD